MDHDYDDSKGLGCLFIVLIVLAIIIVVIASIPKMEYHVVRRNIVKVMMHEPERYSVLVQDTDKSLKTLTYRGCKLIADVPKNESMWLEIEMNKAKEEVTDEGYHYKWAKIHIHSADQLNGAGWDHGKHGRGQTEVVE